MWRAEMHQAFCAKWRALEDKSLQTAFIGSPHRPRERSPVLRTMRLLREGDLNIVGPEVMAAARAFIAGV